MTKKCEDCGEDVVVEFSDPREPPLDEEVCLCRDCAINAFSEAIDDAEQHLLILRHEALRLGLKLS